MVGFRGGSRYRDWRADLRWLARIEAGDEDLIGRDKELAPALLLRIRNGPYQ